MHSCSTVGLQKCLRKKSTLRSKLATMFCPVLQRAFHVKLRPEDTLSYNQIKSNQIKLNLFATQIIYHWMWHNNKTNVSTGHKGSTNCTNRCIGLLTVRIFCKFLEAPNVAIQMIVVNNSVSFGSLQARVWSASIFHKRLWRWHNLRTYLSISVYKDGRQKDADELQQHLAPFHFFSHSF